MLRIRVVDVVRIVTALFHRGCVGKMCRGASDPILALRGTGKEMWADEDADAYINRLRQGWR